MRKQFCNYAGMQRTIVLIMASTVAAMKTFGSIISILLHQPRAVNALRKVALGEDV